MNTAIAMRAITLPRIIATVVLTLSAWLFGIPAAADTDGCFCLENPRRGDFLWGCREFKPPNAATVRAFCRHPQTGAESFEPVLIRPPWVRIEGGEGDCAPCRPWERDIDSTKEIPRTGGEKADRDGSPPGE